MKQRRWWVAAVQFTGLGWYVATAIVVPTLAGAWLDGRLGVAPVFLLGGLAIGLGLAFYGGYRLMSSYLSGSRGREGNGRDG